MNSCLAPNKYGGRGGGVGNTDVSVDILIFSSDAIIVKSESENLGRSEILVQKEDMFCSTCLAFSASKDLK